MTVSIDVLKALAASVPLRLLKGEGRGAAAAINTGVRAARFSIICQVDQDVLLEPNWMRCLTREFDDPAVVASQGYYVTAGDATMCARAMSLDLEQRYAAIRGGDTDHVCSGNAAYRVDALRRVGLFDESLGYGYDNDVSYRLRAEGLRLTFCRSARSTHRWREGLIGYLRQQYGFGYGRIDLVAKHPRRFSGDTVSPRMMMWHPLLMSMALAALLLARIVSATGGASSFVAFAGAGVIAILVLERTIAGVRAALRFKDPTPLLFPVLHLARDFAWVAAIVVWLARRLGGRPAKPSHSMHPRPFSFPQSSAPNRPAT